VNEFIFRTKPFPHQLEEFNLSRDYVNWALFWEQGTGKTKMTIDIACHLYQTGKIDAVLVVAPNGVHANWVYDEFPRHCNLEVEKNIDMMVFKSAKGKTKRSKDRVAAVVRNNGMSVISMTFDAICTDAGKQAAWDLLSKRRVLYVCDEGHKIKNPKAVRTEVVVSSAQYAHYRRLLTGTPIANGAMDIYSQIQFLDPLFWKHKKLSPFTVFKSKFAEWREKATNSGKRFKILVRYKNIEELAELVKSISSRVTKDILGLPPKMYSRRYFEMTAEQARIYKDMKDNSMALLGAGTKCENCDGTGWVDLCEEGSEESFRGECPCCEGTGLTYNGMITSNLAITTLLRLQQILCGYVPKDDEDEMYVLPGANPRLQVLEEVAEGLTSPFIVFCKFKKDIELITHSLGEMGISWVRYDGSLNDDERLASKRAFVEGRATAFVAMTSMAAEGLTLTQAKTVIYYNNSFKLLDRLQSEDRAHRIGQDTSVDYVDIACHGTVDTAIIDALLNKLDIASQITGDKLKKWLSESSGEQDE
jgi:SNF2 family DNA or RNA helicase